MIPRKKRNSSKTNLVISAVFHGVVIIAIIFFAAREGILGKKLKEITVTTVPKEKKPEPPKEKPPEPKAEPPKPDAPKPLIPPPVAQTAPPPSSVHAVPSVAPAAVSLPGFDFNDGAHQVQSISDANGIYKALVEHTLRSRWNRPEDIPDDTFAVEAELTVDPSGKIKGYEWVSGSGNKRWDDSVRAVLNDTKAITRPPPKGFPQKMIVRFDVESLQTEDPFQFGK